MDLTNKVLELLYDRGDGFFSLEELSSAAGVSREQLQRRLSGLDRRGCRLEFSPAWGVRLVRPVRLDAHLIERSLGTTRIGRNVICFDEVDSTNDVAFDSARQEGADGMVILAEFQRRGRGRLGRDWISPSGANVLMSVLLVEKDGLTGHEALTIAAGLAVAQGIEDAAGLECRLRWPNDVLLDGAKVAGVLVEIRRRQGRRVIVVGIGVNVNAAPGRDAHRINQPATNLSDHLGHPFERTEVVRAVLRRADSWVTHFSAGRTDELHDEWLSRCGMVNQRVTVVCADRRYTGRVLDVSPMDGLILACDDGRSVHLPAETSTMVS